MTGYPMHKIWTYMHKVGIERVVVDLGIEECHGHPDQFPRVVEAISTQGLTCHGVFEVLANLVWDAAEAEEKAGRLVLDGAVEVVASPAGSRPRRFGDAWAGA